MNNDKQEQKRNEHKKEILKQFQNDFDKKKATKISMLKSIFQRS